MTPLFDQLDTTGLADALDHIIADHSYGAGPFDGLIPPEQTVLDDIDRDEDRLRFLTFGCALDYARPADRHWEQMEYLYDEMHWAFDPQTVVQLRPEVLAVCFASLGVRYYNTDAETWYTIAESLVERANGWVTEVLAYCDHDANELLAYVQGDDRESYPYLGGDKIAPMYVRMIDTYVTDLANVGELPLPVDVQIERVTLAMAPGLVDEYPTQETRRDVIRTFWSELADAHDLPLYRLDEALWQIGRHWDDWGGPYFDAALTVGDADMSLAPIPSELTEDT